jgi:hypothetical protein
MLNLNRAELYIYVAKNIQKKKNNSPGNFVDKCKEQPTTEENSPHRACTFLDMVLHHHKSTMDNSRT